MMGGYGLIVVLVGGGFVMLLVIDIWRYQRQIDNQPNRNRDHQRLMREISRHGRKNE